jgi:hypothetical protein
VTDTAAERVWYAVSPSGEGAELALKVSVPSEHPDMGWGCIISLGILEARSYTIYGTDSWQAIQEAMLFVARRIDYFTEEGWSFYWEKNGDMANASELAYDPKTF